MNSQLNAGCEGFPGHHTARSVWSAASLLALSTGAAGPKAGASSAHSKRFAQFGCGFSALWCVHDGRLLLNA
jgi:hypothetical protein